MTKKKKFTYLILRSLLCLIHKGKRPISSPEREYLLEQQRKQKEN